MAEFLDRQAQESDHEEEGESGAPPAKRKRRVLSDDEDDDEEDEDEAEIADEMRGFVVSGDEEDEDEAGGDAAADKSDESDEDDGDSDDEALVMDNLGLAVPRRVNRRARVDDEDDDDEAPPADDDRSRIGRQLFDGDAPPPADEARSLRRAAADDDDRDRSSESGDSDAGMRSFIVGEDGEERQRQRQRPRARRLAVSERALEEARDIFGVGFDMEAFYNDAEDEEDEEAEEDFDADADLSDEEGGGRRPRAPRRRGLKESTLLGQLEPSEIERGFLSDTDRAIQLEDKPERFQLRRLAVTEAENDELVAEADWIYRFAFCTLPISLQEDLDTNSHTKPPESTPRKILEALNFMRNQQFEVPFIAFYRKEYVEPELAINDLWKIYQWDEKWCHLQQEKRRLISLMHRMQKYQYEEAESNPDLPLSDEIRILSDADVSTALDVQTTDGLDDVLAHFALHYGPQLRRLAAFERAKAAANDELSDAAGSYKHASRSDAYAICLAGGLAGLAAKFGLTPQQFGENLQESFCRHDVDQYPVEPLETAQDYIRGQFDTAERVLDGAKYVVARQLSREPKVRAVLREMFRQRSLVCVVPTTRGRKEIDENHPIYTKKYVKNKPVRDLEKDEFLRLVQAEENGLVTLQITPDPVGERSVPTLLEDLISMNLYYHEGYSRVITAWNELRKAALALCLEKFIVPALAKELRAKLLQEARDFVIRECCQKLYTWLKVGPLVVERRHDDDDDASAGVRVLGIAYCSGMDKASFCAVIDGEGEVIDHLRLVNLTKRRTSNRRDDAQLKMDDLETLRRFIVRRRPHAIAVSAESLDAVFLKQDMEALVSSLAESGELSRRVEVEIVDNELSNMFMNSHRAADELGEYPLLLRQAVSLARRLQDALCEFCQLSAADDLILSLSYHPLQDQVSRDELSAALSLEFINRVNEVGVDMNRCLEHSHTAPQLQFVCGLGPRKAAQLLKVLKQNDNLLENRTKLVTLCQMGPKVFMNCAGFIKIDTARVADKTDIYVEVLDSTRVHPETYEWARKMAVDALEYDDTNEDANPASALEEILEAPDRLKDLDLDAFADELQRQGFGNKSITLYDIRAELNHRYKDLRANYTPPSKEELFNMLTKETPQTFNVGKLVMGKVMYVVYRRPRTGGDEQSQHNPVRDDRTGFWQCPLCLKGDFSELSEVWTHFDSNQCPGQAVGVKVRLENGITGFIPTKYLSDKPVENPSDRVVAHMPIYCRVLKVDTERLQAELSCRSADLADREGQFRPPKDRYYDFTAEEAQRNDDLQRRASQQRTNYVSRVIAHPSFANISFKEAERRLANMHQGEVIIRPSSKGADHLTATWKVTDGIYQHIDIREEGKQKPFSLGRSLWIGEEEFEDLDEIIARHVQPLAAHARDVIAYKYFLDPGVDNRRKEVVEERLCADKRDNASRIPYMLMPSVEFPGKFLLSYLPRAKPKHEYVTVTTDGFRFRQQSFPTLAALFRWFKENFRQAPPMTTPSHTATPLVANHGTPGVPFDALSRVSGHSSRQAAQRSANERWGAQPAVAFMPPPPTFGFLAGEPQYANPVPMPPPWDGRAPPPPVQSAGADWANAARNWASAPTRNSRQQRPVQRY